MAGAAFTRSQIKAAITPVGYIEYNGYVFNEMVKTKLEINAVPNHAGTGIKYEEYLFTIEAIITQNDAGGDALNIDPDTSNSATTGGGSAKETLNSPMNTSLQNGYTADQAVRLIRRHLMQPGGRFVYSLKGAGEDLIFDSSNTDSKRRQDIIFGPMPKMLSFEPIGGNRAARIVYQILVRTKYCSNGLGETLGIVDFNVTTNIKTNSNGYKVIQRNGYLEVSLPRVKSGQMAASAGDGGTANYGNTQRIEEQHKEIIQKLIGVNMQGYKVEHELNFSPDHRVCNFNILYTEIESPNAFPNGVTSIKCSHNLKSSLYGDGDNPYGTSGYFKWLNTISATITLRPNVNPIKAWYIFTQILNERLQYETERDVEFGDIVRIKVPLILDIELEEELFSHEYKFRVTWMMNIDIGKDDVFDKTKLLKPLESTNWFDWTTDMRLSSNSINGAYPLVPGKHGSTYYETTLCNQDQMDLHYSVNLETTRGFPTDFMFSLFGTKCPPESSSWVDYQRKYYVVGDIGEKTYQRYNVDDKFYRPELNADPTTDKKFQMLDYFLDSPEEDYYTQDYKKDEFEIVERGYAIRLGGPTKPPVWKEIGGKKVKPMSKADIITHHVISSAGDCPMVATTWERRYKVLGKPDGDLSRAKQESGDPKYKQ